MFLNLETGKKGVVFFSNELGIYFSIYLAATTNNLNFRFEENVYKSEDVDDTEGEESDDSSKGRKRGDRKKRREDEEYRPDELAFNKSEYFRV